MSYSKYAEVQSYYLGINFETSDIITAVRVKKWINEASIRIDTSLRRKYTLPITDEDDIVFLKLLCEKYVVGKIDPILRLSGDEDEKKMMRDRNYASEFNKELSELINGQVQLITSPKNLAPIKLVKGSS